MTKNIKESIEYNILWGIGKIASYVQPRINWIKGHQFKVDEVCAGIYISDFASACDYNELKKNGITHIVTAILGVSEMNPDQFKYFIVDVPDRSYADISKYFDDCSDFIDKAITNGGKVLVHCQCGISRSTTMIMAYLIKKKNFTVSAALEIIKKCRNGVQPNEGFVKQLQEYEAQVQLSLKKIQ